MGKIVSIVLVLLLMLPFFETDLAASRSLRSSVQHRIEAHCAASRSLRSRVQHRVDTDFTGSQSLRFDVKSFCAEQRTVDRYRHRKKIATSLH